MHNHNNDNKDGGHKGMLWMMIPCLLLLGFLFIGGGTISSSKYLWLILIGVCVVPHIWMMFKGHGGHGGHSDADEKTHGAEGSNTKDEHKKGGCCH